MGVLRLGLSSGDVPATVSAAFLAMVDQIIEENRALLDALAIPPPRGILTCIEVHGGSRHMGGQMSDRLYLNDILKRIEMIERFTEDGEAAFLMSDLIQEGVIRCFEVIGEAVKRLDPARLAAFPMVPWHDVAGFRDMLIHHYNEINIERVWDTVVTGVPPLREAIEALLASIPPDSSE